MFMLRKEAEDWFKHIDDDIKLKFDMYYFCFISGIAEKRKSNQSSTNTIEIVRDFPGPYKDGIGYRLIALFLSRELEQLGVDMKDKSNVRKVVTSLVSTSPPYLSENGAKEFNKYAHGGYDVLTQWFERPNSMEAFLIEFHKKINETLTRPVRR